jgi:dihydrofolate reductase
LILSTSYVIDSITTTNINNKTHNTISKSFNNIKDLESFIYKKKYDEIWVIGGEEIYKLFLNNCLNSNFIVSKLYVTYIKKSFLCDTFFPKINNKYKITNKVSSSIEYFDNNTKTNNSLDLEDIIYELV